MQDSQDKGIRKFDLWQKLHYFMRKALKLTKFE